MTQAQRARIKPQGAAYLIPDEPEHNNEPCDVFFFSTESAEYGVFQANICQGALRETFGLKWISIPRMIVYSERSTLCRISPILSLDYCKFCTDQDDCTNQCPRNGKASNNNSVGVSIQAVHVVRQPYSPPTSSSYKACLCN